MVIWHAVSDEITPNVRPLYRVIGGKGRRGVKGDRQGRGHGVRLGRVG